VAAVAMANGLNPNVVHKWLAGQGLKRMAPASAQTTNSLGSRAPQFVPVGVHLISVQEVTVRIASNGTNQLGHRTGANTTAICCHSRRRGG
jgi:hypothetical protein